VMEGLRLNVDVYWRKGDIRELSEAGAIGCRMGG
jgi:hypothetical protein